MKRLTIKTITLTGFLLISMALAACQGTTGANSEETVQTQPTPVISKPDQEESVDQREPDDSDKDALVDMAKMELAQFLNIGVEQITLESVSELDVNNNTYSIKLNTDTGQMYEYHGLGNSVILMSEPLPPAPVEETTFVPIDKITVTMMTDSEVQVVAKGNLLQGCNVLNEPEVVQEAQFFQITLTRNEMIQRPCTNILVPFEETIVLDVAELSAGEYTVEVNGVSETFMLTEATTMITPEQIGFTLDGLATIVFTETIPMAEAATETPPWAIYPEHIQFTFEDYVLSDVLQPARLLVYPTDSYEAMNKTAAEQIERLRTLLAERPEIITEPIPFLPPANADQLMWTRATFLDFQTGTGVRYLTQFAQAIVPVNNQELFYTFQGLTEDEAYYVTVVFPVNHPNLPLNAGDIPAEFEAAFEDYLADVIEQLDEAEAATFMPDLSLLDAFVQSIAIESDHILITDTASLMLQLQAAGASITKTDKSGQPFFPIEAQVWSVNGAEIQLFEFESEQQQQTAAALIQDNGYVINTTAVNWIDPPYFWATGHLIVLYAGTDEATLNLLTDTLGMPITGETSLLEGEYPAAVTAAVELFSQDTGINESTIEIVSVIETQWPGGCLGLAEEGEVCTLAIIPGLQIIAHAQGDAYEIRSDEVGTVMRWQLLAETESVPYP